MEFGWIDFTSEDGEVMRNVINTLEDKDVDLRDALGVGVIRDRFANYFFPGTTTMQSSAKYFFLVPYACQKVEKQKCNQLHECKNELKRIEKEQCNKLLESRNNKNDYNRTIIGSRSIKHNAKWINNAPSNIYWGGLKSFGILKEDISLNEYFTLLINKLNSEKNIKNLTNKKEEQIYDDDNADLKDKTSLWDILPENMMGYESTENKQNRQLSLYLTYDEAKFLKNKIIENKPDSLLAWMLKNQADLEMLKSAVEIKDLSFDDLKEKIIDSKGKTIYDFLPEKLQKLYMLAKNFSDFFYILEIRYNLMYSKFKNQDIMERWESVKKYAKDYASRVEIDEIFRILKLQNMDLKDFLKACKNKIDSMNRDEFNTSEKLNELDLLIQQRELKNKTAEYAKLLKPIEGAAWTGLDKLTYRIVPGRNIVYDILKGLENSNE